MAQFPSTTAADGIWTLKKVRRAILGDNWPPLVYPDEFFANTVLLLQADDVTDGSQNNTFLDASTNAHTITRNGNVTQGSFSPFSQDEGKWGNYFDGSGDSLSVPADASHQFGTGDFTVEFWVYMNSVSSDVTFVCRGQASPVVFDLFIQYRPSISNNLKVSTGVTSYVPYDFSWTPSANTWYHVAVTRAGTDLKAFIDGQQIGTTQTDSNNMNANVTLGVGYNLPSDIQHLNGYMSNLRIVKGTAVYTSAFTPSTTPLTAISGTSLLTCQSNRFVDNSSNAHSITVNGDPEVTPFSPFAPSTAYNPATKGGSGYFDGTGDYLQTASDSSLVIGTGDFTVEAWIYPTLNNGTHGIICNRTDQTADTSQFFFGYAGTTLLYYADVDATSASGTLQLNTWSHVACTRSSGTVRVFHNGTQVASVTDTVNKTRNVMFVGSGGGTTGQFAGGYISNARFVNGTAVYTSAFTPPTAPVSAVSGTSLLCNFTNAGIYDGTGRNVLETVGDAHVENSVKKYGTGSMQFDGTGDRLVGKETELLAFGTGDYTIEFWMYPRNTGYGCWIDTRNANPSTTGIAVFNNGTGLEVFGNGYILNVSSVITLNTWQHFALTRSGTDLKSFIDGTQVGTTQTNSDNHTAGRLMIGDNVTVAYPLNGYIDDLRITKGVARYTANFTPPAAKLEQQ